MREYINLKNLLMFLSISLTIVSLNAGFHLYENLFNINTAFLISIVFEILRLSTLYSISLFRGYARTLSGLLYAMIALICFTAAVVSYDSQIIQKHSEYNIKIEKQMESDLYLIKKKMAEKYDGRLIKLQETKETIQKRFAANPRSKYYANRMEQVDLDIEKFEIERQTELDKVEFGKVDSTWIKTQKAILNLDDVVGIYDNNLMSYEKAASELFRIDVVTLQKAIGYSLGFAIEAGILLLALLSLSLRKNKNEKVTIKEVIVQREPIKENSVVEYPDDRFEKKRETKC